MKVYLEMPLKNLLDKAWMVRLSNFPRLVIFTRPTKTLAISVTGDKCQLNCPHCNGHYLKSMVPAHCHTSELLEKIDLKRYFSVLISGGSSEDGVVPFSSRKELFMEFRRAKKRINLHPGLVNEEDARIAALASACSFDFIVDENTIRDIYGLKKTSQDFIDSYMILSKHVNRIIPHINIGLPGAGDYCELKALELLLGLRVDAITFIIFTPTRGTTFENFVPPTLSYIGKILTIARIVFPTTPLYLGCMRPGGRYRERVDNIALNAGVNKIVSPTPAVKKLAEDKGFMINWQKECCAL